MSIFTVDVKGEDLTIYVYVNGTVGVATVYEELGGGYFVSVWEHGYYYADTIIEAKRLVFNFTREDAESFVEVDDEESEDNEEPDTYTVALMTNYGYGNESCHPLAVGVDHATARSIKRHYDKTCHWSDYTQTGDYVTIVSRKWCTNHEDFEHEYTWDDDFDGEEAF